MKLNITVMASALLWVGQPVLAESLLLKVQQQNNAVAPGFQLLHAQKGSFAAKPAQQDADENDLLIVGRDHRGRELFRTTVRDPGVIHAESFNPKTGAIESVRSIRQEQSQFEVSVPAHADLGRVEIIKPVATRRGVMSDSSAPTFAFDVAEIEQQLKRSADQPMMDSPATSTMLVNTGPSSGRFDIILVGDGYTAAEQGKWAQVAKSIADGIMADPMFAAHKGGINIRRVDIASAQSGVTELDTGVRRDTAYNMTLGCYNIQRLACVDYNRVHQIIDPITSPDGRDLVVAVANSSRYGGGGGPMASLTAHPSSIEVALHEIGHTAFKLADEYDYGTCDTSYEPSEVNATLQTSRSAIKWASLIPGNVSLPTRPGSVANGTIGLFAGSRYCASGMYRPTENSKMRNLGQPWHAVNEARIKAVFAQYYKPDTGGEGNGEVRLTGNLGYSGSWNNLPAKVHRSNKGGQFKLKLSGPANADFELALYKWTGKAWTAVATSTGPTSTEAINYNGTAGDYYIEVKSYSGQGAYSVTYQFPA
ncbi:M64 family metallopeptidase [Parachitinimonas caeni]|uniref:M64 family metallopeptidase n=1 Tax=Parachitinimonas caeni TaxID=3031301 RepID=A0ABT7E7D1_9NEIS|nr:M64 family metallopeptidase [Parachitinimonas caeni]MDK2126822.1 M64 family metallopeptidase [Parachitinimonas caeni]